MNHEQGHSLGIVPGESNWQERAVLARAVTEARSIPQEQKLQSAPHYIKVIVQGMKYLDSSQSVRTEWVRCPDCRNGYHGH